ncbi:MAG TPA: DUF707 domain-containing protein [Clostridium sp.]|nr:DUF707 domain-containing protein [Clostridium sp.]
MKNLIVVRCGDKSLHEKWLTGNANFDVAVSYFGDDFKFDKSNLKYLHIFKGSKWEGLSNFFETLDFWKEYDAICLPDDDLDSSTEDLNKFFELFHLYNFDLAQPSLDSKSFYSWAIVLQNKSFKYRETNFVEVMIPCFNKQAFEKLYSTFKENISGWGLDHLWPKLLGNTAKVGIIDEVSIFHTRPIGVAGNGMGRKVLIKENFFSKSKFLTPQMELKKLIKKYKIDQNITCSQALDIHGNIIAANSSCFIKNFISGCDDRLIDNVVINYGYLSIGVK